MDSNDRPKSAPPAPLIAAALASVVLLAVIWSVDYLPTHDGPQQIFGAFLNNHLADAERSYQEVFRPGSAVTSLGFSVPFSVLESILPWRTALNATLSMILMMWSWGFFYLCRTLHPERAWVGLLGFACALQWPLYMGFFSYVASCAVGFFVLALGVRRWPWQRKDRVLIALLLTIQAVFHIFGALVIGALLGVIVIGRTRGRGMLKEVGWLLVMSAPTLAIIAIARDIAGPKAVLQYVATSVDELSFLDHVKFPAALFFGGPWWRRWPLVALSVGALGIGCARTLRKQAREEEGILALGALILLAVSIVAPINLARWDYFSPRFLPFALMTPMALLPLEQWKAQRTVKVAAAAAACAYLAANLLWLGWYDRDLRARCDDALSGLAAPVRRNGARLPIVLEPTAGLPSTSLSANMPYAFPLRNVGALYSIEQGGIVPYLFVIEPHIHEYVMKPGLDLPRVPDRAYVSPLFESATPNPLERDVILNYMASFGVTHEDVILVGKPQDADAMLARGFVEDWRRGGVLISHFVGCPSRVRLQSAGPLAHTTRLSFGWFPSMQAQWALPDGAHTTTVDLPGAPCGTVWVRAFVDQDESGELSAGDLVCEHAAPNGIVLMRLSQAAPTVDCPLVSVK
jgi:hypothetical protein